MKGGERTIDRKCKKGSRKILIFDIDRFLYFIIDMKSLYMKYINSVLETVSIQ